MRVAIMQPYFLPYIGYWQLISAVDAFVVYDNIKYTKKGWINRNRFLLNGKDAVFSLPLKKDSDQLDVRQRHLADSFNRDNLLNRIREAYRKSPFFSEREGLLEELVRHPSNNLFEYLFHSIRKISNYLQIKTPIIISSSIDCDHSLKSSKRVQAICKSLGADTYVNPIGGIDLYSIDDFFQNEIRLIFLNPNIFEYRQNGGPFIPNLSIIDVLMFNGIDRIIEELGEKTGSLSDPQE